MPSEPSGSSAARRRGAARSRGVANGGEFARGRPPRVSGLEDHLGFWLRFVSNAVSARFEHVLEGEGVSIAEWVVLRSLFHSGGVNAAQLVRALGMTKGGVSKIIARLHARGLVTRAAVDADRRAQQLLLTPAGQVLVPRLAGLADDNDARFFGCLTPDQRRSLMHLMRKIVDAHELSQARVD